jgi:hypothetical protein
MKIIVGVTWYNNHDIFNQGEQNRFSHDLINNQISPEQLGDSREVCDEQTASRR